MISSALFHTFSCHSEQAHRGWQETDHFGIIWAMFGTYVPFLCQAFHCHFVSKFIYYEHKSIFSYMKIYQIKIRLYAYIFFLKEYKIFHLVVVASMVAVVVGSRYSDKIARFTKVQREDSKSGIQLKVTLIVACYFIVPLLHWIWLYGGLQNQVVLVSLLLDIYPM